MAIIFSKKCEYGIQGVLYLALKGIGTVTPVEEIAEHLQIPREFISKILQELTSKKIIGSKKGKNGGFFLAKSPAKIKLYDIVIAIDGDAIFGQCVLGFPNCSGDYPCPVHDNWSKLIKETYAMLNAQTLDQFKDKVSLKIQNLGAKKKNVKVRPAN